MLGKKELMEEIATSKSKFTSTALAAVAFACFLALASKDTKDFLNNFSMACFALALPLLFACMAIEESIAETKTPEKARHVAKYWEAIGAVLTAYGLALLAFGISIYVGSALCLGFVVAIGILFYAGFLRK